MPRRALPTIAIAPVTTLQPPPPPSPLVQQLRKDWRWAGISQFIWTFSDAFGLLDWDIEALEADLDGDETALIPTLIAKMLYALTYNRQINHDNAFEHLRKQYLKRAPESTILGTEEDPRAWAALGLGEKILRDLCEWQMTDPGRFRALLKSEEEAVSWRIEPVGWDKEGNTYFLFDDNRLWVQRLPPAPPRPLKSTSTKSKLNKRPPKNTPALISGTDTLAPTKKSHKKRPISPDLTPPPPEPVDEAVSGRRKRTQVAFYGNPQSTVEALKRGSASGLADSPSSSRKTRHSSRYTSGLNAVDSTTTPSKLTSKPAPPIPAPRSTRTSRRSRAGEEEWQAIPKEWLNPDPPSDPSSSRSTLVASSSAKRKREKDKVAAEDEESELSTLTDEEEHEAKVASLKKGARGRKKGARAGKKVVKEREEKVEVVLPEKEDTPLTDLDDDDEYEELIIADDASISKKKAVDKEEPTIPDDQRDDVGTAAAMEEDTVIAEEIKPDDNPSDGTSEIPANGIIGDTDETLVDAAKADSTIPIMTEDPAKDVKQETDEVKLAARAASDLPVGYIEWEAVCVTLYDWRSFPERFAKSRDPDEKNLYKLLTVDVGPTVIEALVAKEQERLRQEAINNRKRSSRIATKELEKEEILRGERAQREMEERMEKSRRDETARLRAETQAVSQEKAREDRLKEREERLAARENAALERAAEEIRSKEKADRARIRRQRRREGEEVESSSDEEGGKNGSSRLQTPQTQVQPVPAAQGKVDEGWELDCEICRKSGWNPDDDSDVVCCDDCGKWQHTECHDRQDASEGRPRRNWDKVDFKCKDCRRRAARKRQRLSHEQIGSSPLAPPHATQVNGVSAGKNGQGVQIMQIQGINTVRPPPSAQQAYTGGQAARAYISAQNQSQPNQRRAPSQASPAQPKPISQYQHQQPHPGYPLHQPPHEHYPPAGYAVPPSQQRFQYLPPQSRPSSGYAGQQAAYPAPSHAHRNPTPQSIPNPVPRQATNGYAYSSTPTQHSPAPHAQTIPHGSSHPFGPNPTGSPSAIPGYPQRSGSVPQSQQAYPPRSVQQQHPQPIYAPRSPHPSNAAHHPGYTSAGQHSASPRAGQAIPQMRAINGGHAQQMPIPIQQKSVSTGQELPPTLIRPHGA